MTEIYDHMKKFKLKVHQSNFCEESLIINSKDFPDVREDDIVKISTCESDPSNYLVIKVKSLKKEVELQRETVSIEQKIASRFGLNAFQSVHVTKVDPVDISLDMLEVTFKDQYISRSDMWRLKKHLVGSCTCLDEKVEFSDIRAQVNELWINSSKVKCGLITDYTRIVLRSASALVYIFIQMSSEMWDFDAYGQLQFERAVNGFLKELFLKWKEKCYHEFTLVLFSRVYYEADINEFADDVREIVLKDYKGRYFIDFYKCVAHSERNEDCMQLLFVLKKIFNEYEKMINIPGCPKGTNSTSSEGNFLEAINMSLNMFEKHYIDRNFDRTGQLVMCITPGVGVFDVDRDLTILTKERMIDNGIGSDLVCLGHPPLHAVPLFKYHHKDKPDIPSSVTNKARHHHHDFNIPHWINHSFYTSNPFPDNGTTGIKYIPRIRMTKPKQSKQERKASLMGKTLPGGILDANICPSELPSFLEVKYEEFDRKIFKLSRATLKEGIAASMTNSRHSTSTPRRSTSIDIKKASHQRIRTISDEWRQNSNYPGKTNPLHIPIRYASSLSKVKTAGGIASSVGADANREKYLWIHEENAAATELVVGSAHSLQGTTRKQNVSGRALINPFIMTRGTIPLTSNRRRWVHTYPRHTQKEGVIQQYPLMYGMRMKQSSESSDLTENDEDSEQNDSSPIIGNKISSYLGSSGERSGPHSHVGSMNSSEMSCGTLDMETDSPRTCILTDKHSATHKGFPHSPGVDWKSLRSPACLPITNDYFPSKLRLQNEYVEQSYSLIPDHDDQQYDGCSQEFLAGQQGQISGWQMPSSQHVSTREIFLELVNQRLCQGFQLVVSERWGKRRHYNSTTSFTSGKSPSPCGDISFLSTGSTSPGYPHSSMLLTEDTETYMLNHGRQYHIVSLSGENEIKVKIYRPRHTFCTAIVEYKYLLWAVSRDRFRCAKVKFAHEQYESYYWNYQDNYICSSGADMDFKLFDNIKYWRSKFIVIPSAVAKVRAQKSESELAQKEGRSVRFDIFANDIDAVQADDDFQMTLDGFIRFLEFINKIRQLQTSTPTARRSWRNKQVSTMTSTTGMSLPTTVEQCSKTPSIPGTPVNTNTNMQSTTTPPSNSTPTSGRTTPVRVDMEKPHNSPPNISGKHTNQRVDAKHIPLRVSNLVQLQNNSSSNGDHEVQDIHEALKKRSLNTDSDMKDIVKAMKDKRSGSSFLPHQRGLHGWCFLSIEGVLWSLCNVSGIDSIADGCQLFQRLCAGRYICHASGDFSHRFINGTYIYYITDETSWSDIDLDDPISYQHPEQFGYNARCFSTQWLEVEIKNDCEKKETTAEALSVTQRPKSALSHLLETHSVAQQHKARNDKDLKTVLIAMQNKHKTSRMEWCQVQYPSVVTPWHGSIIFSFNMQWMVATATCLCEMLQSWSREASRCKMFMLPTPNNPFSFPHYEKDASPLHCPLFMHVHFKAIYNNVPVFKELHNKGIECRRRIIDFMEEIAIRFGFLRYFDHHDAEAERSCKSPNTSQRIFTNANSRLYVHYTGQVFLKIPITDKLQVQGHSLIEKQQITKTHQEPLRTLTKGTSSHISSPRKKTRHRSGFTVEGDKENCGRIDGHPDRSEDIQHADLETAGFYFTSNLMLNKRWRIAALDDCPASKLESDFMKFCENCDNRLLDFYNKRYS